jgi:hypothetical protein
MQECSERRVVKYISSFDLNTKLESKAAVDKLRPARIFETIRECFI